ncbi:C40 family peptidase [Aurantibacillus circumpalustris]|uniref:C40 family peptidase n=1 Tax=Aurantibacillus circumpalustris TaxID=3036359 RepID=UPI00295B71C9|nr:C40 family peptidase [Aurantibacillus circumpalustris]
MIKSGTYSRLLLLLFLIGAYNCKHKEKQAVALQKSSTKKQTHKLKPQSHKPSGTKSKSTDLEQKLGLNDEQIRNSKLYSFIDDWYGTPYKYGGCQKGGVDCSCFANLLYEKVYDKRIARSSVDIYKSCDEISIKEAKTGDFVFFKIGGNMVSHVGVYIWGNMFVHASNSRGVVINSLEEAYYKKYFFCAGKMKSL